MKQKIPTSQTELLARAEEALGGVDEFGAALNLSRVTQSVLLARIAALRSAREQCDTGRAAISQARNTVNSLAKTTSDYLKIVRDTNKPHLGTRHNESWILVGFPEGFEVPTSSALLQERVYRTFTYLAANPSREIPSLNATAAHGEALFEELKAARNAVNLLETEVGQMRDARDTAAKELDKTLRHLVSELKLAMSPLDSRWKAFGFNLPGAQETPDAPAEVTATLTTPTTAAVKWANAPRADYYHVWLKVIGVDEDYRRIGSPRDLDFTIEEIPPAAHVQLAISTINNGGESPLSEPVMLATP